MQDTIKLTFHDADYRNHIEQMQCLFEVGYFIRSAEAQTPLIVANDDEIPSGYRVVYDLVM